ncbi:hypothetical protein K445DRAFT_57441 [Daldinia sp. EC12]|nr:hypothetical protein K445DRAFT_57441 [Daldinia sp. EC12]
MNRIIRSPLPQGQLARFGFSSRPDYIFHRHTTHFPKVNFLDVEPSCRYDTGGYHPVHIGDLIHNRYRVVHKVGFGDFSTVWLARDRETNKLVAVKVGTADSDPKQADKLSSLSLATGSNFFPPVLDRFEVRGANGIHSCYVREPALGSLANLLELSPHIFRPHVARVLIAQLVLSMAAMHSRGFVHGDFHLGNVLLRAPSAFQDLSNEELYQIYHSPYCEPIVPTEDENLPSNIPSYGVIPVFLGKLEEVSQQAARIWICDLREPITPSAENIDCLFKPMECCPPELLFSPEESKVSYSSDIWALACSIWNLLGERPLFGHSWEDSRSTRIAQVDHLGPSGMPSSWWDNWKDRSSYYTEAHDPLPDHAKYIESWDTKFGEYIQYGLGAAGYPKISPKEKKAIINMLQPMLTWKPEDRCTASQVLKSEWMTQWVLPEYQKLTT